MADHLVLQHPQYLSHRFVPIARDNFSLGRGGNDPQYVVIHIMQGSYEGSISWAQRSESNVSWHYACSLTGHTTQNVGEHNTAWTNSNFWVNQRAISIEHEGFHPRRADQVPDAQLHASAKLTAGICYRHSIPVDREHIVGHNEVRGVTKPCPSGWPWDRYIQLVRAYKAGTRKPAEPKQDADKKTQPIVLKYGLGKDGNPNSSYIRVHPTHYRWTDALERLTARIANDPRFRGKVWITSYRDHPPGSRANHPPLGRDMDSLDVWGFGGRGDPLPVKVGLEVFNEIFRNPDPPDIDWVIYRGKIWARTYGWRDAPPGPVGSDPDHLWHIHVTFRKP